MGTSCDEIEGEQEDARESFNPIHTNVFVSFIDITWLYLVSKDLTIQKSLVVFVVVNQTVSFILMCTRSWTA